MVLTTSILDLPPELILEIGQYLPPDAILALNFSHPAFHRTLPPARQSSQTPLSNCARLAIRDYLSPPDPTPSHIRCILCNGLYPPDLFKSSNSPACVRMSPAEPGTEVVEMPQRLCLWHVGSLARVIRSTEAGSRNEWVSHRDDMCMHCGAVRGWQKCGCNCDSCFFKPVKTYTRYLNNDRECKEFKFWRARANRGQHGQLWVRETCWNPGEFCISGINNIWRRLKPLAR